MLTLKEWMELVDYKVTEGSDYYTNIPGLYSLSAWNGEHEGWSFFIGFDPKDDQRVYVVEVCDYANKRAYRLKDPDIVLDDQAWDECDFVDLEEDDDFFQKGLAIKAGENYDTRVNVPLTVPDDVLFKLMKRAHEQDITLNQLVEDVLWTAIRAEESRRSEDDDDGWDELAEEDHWDDEILEDEPPKKKRKSKKK